jgi:hypothetical protein
MAVRFVAISIKNDLSLTFPDFAGGILDFLENAELRDLDKVLEYVAIVKKCSERMCDILLKRLEDCGVAKVLVWTAHVFLIAQDELMERGT